MSIVVEYPEIVSVSEDMTDKPVLESTSFSLDCHVRGNPRPKIVWTMNDKDVSILHFRAKITVTDGRLVVKGATSKDHIGEYKCRATNIWGTVESRRIKVDIKGIAFRT